MIIRESFSERERTAERERVRERLIIMLLTSEFAVKME